MSSEQLGQRFETLERELSTVGELIRLDSRVNESRFAAVLAKQDQHTRMLESLKHEVEALPRTLAEMSSEGGRSR